MSKQPLAVICALAFTVGGAAALVSHYTPRDAAGVRGVAEESADAARREAAETNPLTGHAAEAAPADETAEGGDDAPAAADEGGAVVDEAEGREVEPAVKSDVRAGGVRGRADRRPKAARAHTVVSRREAAGGGRGVAGRTVRGVKRAGAAVGKTLGKIGGVFHD